MVVLVTGNYIRCATEPGIAGRRPRAVGRLTRIVEFVIREARALETDTIAKRDGLKRLAPQEHVVSTRARVHIPTGDVKRLELGGPGKEAVKGRNPRDVP